MNKEVVYTFYFTNGRSVSVGLTAEQAKVILTSLKKDWDETTLIHEEYGMNMALCTHYEKKVKKD